MSFIFYFTFLIALFLILKNQYKIYKKRKLKSVVPKIFYRILVNEKSNIIEISDKDFSFKYLKFQDSFSKEIFIPLFYSYIFPVLLEKMPKNEKLNILKKYWKYYDIEGPYFNENVFVKKGDVVIDAGAHIGTFSALCASLGATVYAFEPVSITVKKYLSKVAELYPNIHIVPIALSDKEGDVEIKILEEKLGSSSIVLNREGSIKEKVPTISLDEWVKRNNISKIDFIKADIEGAERLMLKGAVNVLKNFAPKLSICTYHLKDDKEVLTKLILQANPDYNIKYSSHKLYAWVK